MAFTQTIEAETGGFYTGNQVESVPTNAQDNTFTEAYTLLQEDIPPATQSAANIETTPGNPPIYQVPVGTDLVTGITVNGIYTEDITYDPVAGTITVNPTSSVFTQLCS